MSWDFSGKGMEVISEETRALSQVSQLNIDVSSMSVEVLESQDSQMKIIFSSNQNAKNRSQIVVDETGGTLTIRQEWKWRFGIFISVREHLQVYLPKDYDKNFALSAQSGSVTMNIQNTLGDFSAKLSSGYLKMKESAITCETYTVRCTSGTLSLGRLLGSGSVELTSGLLSAEEISGDRHTVKAGSGGMTIGKITGNVDVRLTSGRMTINELNGQGDISSSSGRLDLVVRTLTGDCVVNSTSGGVNIDIAEDQAFKFEGKCTSGSIRTNFDVSFRDGNGKNSFGTVGDNPQHTLRCKVTSGGIKVNRNQLN